MKCFICGNDITFEEGLNVITCHCKKCGEYAYEKNFMTTFDYFLSSNSSQRQDKVKSFLKKYVRKHHICFVDDFETSLVEGYELKELRDILNMAGIEVTHNNTIDSNWTD